MNKLDDKRIQQIVREIMAREPYKTEFDNPYYRGVTKQMLRDAINSAVDAMIEANSETWAVVDGLNQRID